MKIAIVVPIVGNFGRKGFYHSQEIGLGKELARSGHEVIVYKCVSKQSMSKVTEEWYEGITVRYIPTRSIGPHGLFKPTAIPRETDLVFTFSDTQLVIPALYHYCKKNAIKFIPYVGIAHSFQKSMKSKIMDLIFKCSTLQVYKKVKVVTKTDHARQELMSMGVKECTVAPVGLDLSSLKSDFEQYDRGKLRRKWGFTKDDVLISFIARLQPEKKPLELLDIFNQLKIKNKKLIIVGDGPLWGKLKERVMEFKLEDAVVIIPQVKYDEIWEIHYIADYFLNLRNNEIFGMAIMEAIYYKSCVLAISAPGPNTILNNMKSHIMCKDFSHVSHILNINFISYDNLNSDRNKLINEFSWSKCCNLIETL